jgi:DNA-binding transcriptional LysR family regulator
MRIDPERLLVLRAVADAGSVTAAARRLRLAPSGVSQHLAALERETGLQLVDRSRRGGQRPLRLTAEGRRLAGHATRLAEVLADAEADVQALAGQVEGTVVVAAFPTVIGPVVVPALESLARSHPGLHPSVVEVTERSALDGLQAGEIDLVLVEDDAQHPRPPTSGCGYRWLTDDRYRLAMPAAWPQPESLGDLQGRPWVDGPPGSAVHQALGRLRAGSGQPLPGRHSCLEFPAALALVSGGLAAALVPDLALTAPPAGVRVVDVAGLGARRISAGYRTGRRVSGSRGTKPRPAEGIVIHAMLAAAGAGIAGAGTGRS